MLTVLDIIKKTSAFLADKGVESPRLNAEHLVGHALGLRRMQLYLQFERPLAEPELEKIRPLVRRRAQREPLQHILGETEFFGLKIKCDRRALIPRPETELLVELVTTLLPAPPAAVLDLGTGTGCLLLAALTSLFGEAALYRGSVLLLIVATAVLIAATHLGSGGVIALTILSGLALAPIYPLIVSFFLARTGNHPRLGPVFAVASLGGATLPWLTGAISTHFHALRDGLAVPAAGAVLLLILAPKITARQAKQRA